MPWSLVVCGIVLLILCRIFLRKKKVLVIFDWNNTLLDDVRIWFAVVDEVFRKRGKEPPTTEEYFRELQHDYLEVFLNRGIDVSRDELGRLYFEKYQASFADIELYPHVAELLSDLSRQRYALALVTGQAEQLALPLLERFGILRHFAHLRFHSLDKTADIEDIIAEERAEKAHCFLVTDTPGDIAQATAAGIVSIGFSTAHVPHDALLAAKPDYVVDDLRSVFHIVYR